MHWTNDINTELPIKLRPNGPGSEAPRTVPIQFIETAEKYRDKPALRIERNNKEITLTWKEYLD